MLSTIPPIKPLARSTGISNKASFKDVHSPAKFQLISAHSILHMKSAIFCPIDVNTSLSFTAFIAFSSARKSSLTRSDKFIANFLKSTASKKSTNFCIITAHVSLSLSPFTNDTMALNIPFTNFENVSPVNFASHFLKKRLHPLAKLVPNCFHLNSLAKLSKPCNAVLSAPAITSAVDVKTLFPFLSFENKPLRNSASPVPKPEALAYILSHSMPPTAFPTSSRIVSPRPSQSPDAIASLILSAKFAIF